MIRARVGRHTKEGGRQCQNWADDQTTITGLLNRIAVDNGGAAGSLKAPIRQGICGDALYSAIVQFEGKHFAGQRNGYIDPGGAMLKRMENLAAAAAETRLEILRRKVLSMPSVIAKLNGNDRWKAGDRVQLDGLIRMAVNHIDRLKGIKDNTGKPLETLPGYAEVFGRVYIGPPNSSYGYTEKDEIIMVDVFGRRVVVAQMQYGSSVGWNVYAVTAGLPGLILFSDGLCFPLASHAAISDGAAHTVAANFQ